MSVYRVSVQVCVCVFLKHWESCKCFTLHCYRWSETVATGKAKKCWVKRSESNLVLLLGFCLGLELASLHAVFLLRLLP